MMIFAGKSMLIASVGGNALQVTRVMQSDSFFSSN